MMKQEIIKNSPSGIKEQFKGDIEPSFKVNENPNWQEVFNNHIKKTDNIIINKNNK